MVAVGAGDWLGRRGRSVNLPVWQSGQSPRAFLLAATDLAVRSPAFSSWPASMQHLVQALVADVVEAAVQFLDFVHLFTLLLGVECAVQYAKCAGGVIILLELYGEEVVASPCEVEALRTGGIC